MDRREKKRFLQTAAALLIIITGLILLGYPWVSNYLYENQTDSMVNVYEQTVDEMETSDRDRMLDEARQYNENLSASKTMLTDPFVGDIEGTEAEQISGLQYDNLLSEDDTGIMCFLEIPAINSYLPVYHGTSAEVLEKGIGHIEGSSLPVGGVGNHAVLSGHTGVNSAKLFTDLSEVRKGDYFFLHVLGETLAYRVVSINVIEPEDTGKLAADPKRDLVSLLTCTPYGVNTHRLVVTGERCEYTEEVYSRSIEEEKDTDSLWMRSYRKAILIGMAVSAAGIILKFLFSFLRERAGKDVVG